MADFYTELHQILDDRFDLEELRILCVRLSMNHEHLSQQNKQAFIRTLVDYLRRRKRLPDLYEAIRVERPDVHEDLPPMSAAAPSPSGMAAPSAPSSRAPMSTVARLPWTPVVAGSLAIAVVAVALLLTRNAGTLGGSGSATPSTTEVAAGTAGPRPASATNDPSAPTTYRYGGGRWPSWQQTFTTNGADSRISPSGEDLCIEVLNPGHDIWDIEVGPNAFLLASNRSYTLRVTARATSNRIARVHMKYAPGDDIALDRGDMMVIGPEASTHEFGFTLKTDQPVTSAYVSVLVGGKDQGLGTVCLSSVVIEPK